MKKSNFGTILDNFDFLTRNFRNRQGIFGFSDKFSKNLRPSNITNRRKIFKFIIRKLNLITLWADKPHK